MRSLTPLKCNVFHLSLLLISLLPAAALSADMNLQGIFTTIWGDAFGQQMMQNTRYFITDTAGSTTELVIDRSVAEDAGGLFPLNGRMVNITYDDLAATDAFRLQNKFSLPIKSIKPLEAGSKRTLDQAAVNGSQPWVSIMCKFMDISAEPRNLNYFQNMYSSSYPGMDHYWREASYNRINISGSSAYGWYTLPLPRASYIYDMNGDGSPDLDFSKITSDCTNAADSDVYFPDYVGINLMFNADLDGFAWGGSRYISIDGQSKRYRVTWEPPWGYASITVIAHEMGHGFGMPHSSGNYGYTYDNAWDVMSDAWFNCGAASDPTYGCLGQHTIGYHRDLVGWLQPSEKFIFDGNTRVITLERLTQPASNNYLLAKIPISGSISHYYTVESRRRVGYDTKLISDAVIIHEIQSSRSRPAYVIDKDNNGQTADEGAIWRAGETFTDSANNICVKILSQNSTSHTVQIGCQEQPQSSGQSLAPIYLLLLP